MPEAAGGGGGGESAAPAGCVRAPGDPGVLRPGFNKDVKDVGLPGKKLSTIHGIGEKYESRLENAFPTVRSNGFRVTCQQKLLHLVQRLD